LVRRDCLKCSPLLWWCSRKKTPPLLTGLLIIN
jgi:hypothetical protein